MNQNDFLSWLMDQAEGEENEDRALLDRLFALNFAAIHSSSLVSAILPPKKIILNHDVFMQCRP